MTNEQAIQQILSPLRRGQATRHLSVGDTGMGKTTLTRGIIDTAIGDGLVALVLSHDEKDPNEQQYEGTARIDPNDLRNNPPHGDESFSHVVFRGTCLSRRHDAACDPDSLGEMAWEIVRGVVGARTQILLNLDELADALTPNSQLWSGEYIAQAYRKGRSVGISVIAGIQQPQLVPREAFGLAETMALFRMDGREASYLARLKMISDADAEVLPTLAKGEYLLSVKGQRTGDNLSPRIEIDQIFEGRNVLRRGEIQGVSDLPSVQPQPSQGERAGVHSESGEEGPREGKGGLVKGDLAPSEGDREA